MTSTASPPFPTIVLDDVWKIYGEGGLEVEALRGVSLAVDEGDFVAIVGQSGSGKSTLMNIVGCLDDPTRGRYLLDRVDVAGLDEYELAEIRSRKIGFVFQSFNLIPRTSALANVELPLAYAGMRAKDRRQRALAALEIVGLADRAQHQPSELSGGQQQRVAVARAIVTEPALILADEPTGNLDTKSTHELMAVFQGLNRDGRTLMVITHEPEIADHAKRVITVSDGLVVDDQRVGGPRKRVGAAKATR